MQIGIAGINHQIVLVGYPNTDAASMASAITAGEHVEDVVFIIFIICASLIHRVRLREPVKKGGSGPVVIGSFSILSMFNQLEKLEAGKQKT